MSDIQAVTYDDCIPVTPGTAQNFSEPAAGFFVSVAGTIQIVTARNSNVTLTVLAGLIYPIAIHSVLSAGTTATGIFALTTASATYRGLK